MLYHNRGCTWVFARLWSAQIIFSTLHPSLYRLQLRPPSEGWTLCKYNSSLFFKFASSLVLSNAPQEYSRAQNEEE